VEALTGDIRRRGDVQRSFAETRAKGCETHLRLFVLSVTLIDDVRGWEMELGQGVG